MGPLEPLDQVVVHEQFQTGLHLSWRLGLGDAHQKQAYETPDNDCRFSSALHSCVLDFGRRAPHG